MFMKYQLGMNGFHDGLQQVFDNGENFFVDEDTCESIPIVRSFSLYEPGTRVDSIDLDLLSEKNVEDRNVRIVRRG